MPDFQGSESITQAEHISPNKTGDNIQAKRNAMYVFDTASGEWKRVNTKTLGEQLTASESGIVTNSIIHGKTTAGGGSYVDVKVTPSGALVVEMSKATNAYSISAISEDATYKYFWFEDADKNYYVMRKHLTNNVFTYTKGTGGYESVYVNATSGPSGSPTWDSYGDTF